jgi:uncharacterized protein
MEDKISEFSDKCIIIKIHDRYPSIYERVHRCWKINKKRAEQADYVLAVIKGRVEGVFEPLQWFFTCNDKDCKMNKCEKWPCERKGFVGKEAGDDAQKKYLYKYIPDWFMRSGPGPIQYTYEI